MTLWPNGILSSLWMKICMIMSRVVSKKKNDKQCGMNGEICLQLLLLLFWLKDGELQH